MQGATLRSLFTTHTVRSKFFLRPQESGTFLPLCLLWSIHACAVGSHSPEDRRLDVPRIVADIRRRKGIA